MFNPYFLMTFLYLTLAALTALDTAFVNLHILPVFAGMVWLRVHFITLGALTEFIFGLLPGLIAARAGLPRPKIRWDIWLMLNMGLPVLLVGIPMINAAFITTGGVLIFTAVLLLIAQLGKMNRGQANSQSHPGRKFYITGLIYLLLGITIGTGLWQGWSSWLQIQSPIEVHVHANNWGFMSLVFAGLLVDLYPSFSGHALAWPRSITPIFWMMTVGALLLVLGPWVKSNVVSVPGLVLHLSATGWLLVNVIKPLWGDSKLRTPGMLHLVTSYIWILAPVLVAPLIILQVTGFPGAGIEQNAPQALIYGWVLQFGFAIIPFILRRTFVPDAQPRLGGNWFSLITVHLGAILLWIGIFLKDQQALLYGAAYGSWLLALLPVVFELWQIVRQGLNPLLDESSASLPSEPANRTR